MARWLHDNYDLMQRNVFEKMALQSGSECILVGIKVVFLSSTLIIGPKIYRNTIVPEEQEVCTSASDIYLYFIIKNLQKSCLGEMQKEISYIFGQIRLFYGCS